LTHTVYTHLGDLRNNKQQESPAIAD